MSPTDGVVMTCSNLCKGTGINPKTFNWLKRCWNSSNIQRNKLLKRDSVLFGSNALNEKYDGTCDTMKLLTLNNSDNLETGISSKILAELNLTADGFQETKFPFESLLKSVAES